MTTVDVQKFQGSGWVTRAGLIGVLGLAATFVGMVIDPRPSFFSYLLGFSYWAGISLASLILVMLFHTFRAKWPVVVRRPVEAMATGTLIFLPLLIPVIIGMPHLYAKWLTPAADLGHEALHILQHKAGWLNKTFFIVRSVGYLVIAALVASRFFRLSTKQDQSGDANLTAKSRTMGVALLPLIAIVMTFASFDWLMSLEPLWFSTIFGVYFFAGSFLSTMALVIIASVTARGRKDLFGDHVSPDHLHNLGKLLFAFVCFWAYIAISQLLLIWIANLPEETPWYLVRMTDGWKPVGILLILGHFFVPFGILLSKNLKRNPRRIRLVAFWALFIHFVDVYWLVMPTLWPERAGFHWTMITAFFGVGFTAVAFVIWKLRGHYTLPVKDPYLAVSLRYRQP